VLEGRDLLDCEDLVSERELLQYFQGTNRQFELLHNPTGHTFSEFLRYKGVQMDMND
jgi:hypothetical protein